MLYRVFFLDAQDRTAASEELEVVSLVDAIARARMMPTQRPHHEAIEVRLDNRRAVRLRRERAA